MYDYRSAVMNNGTEKSRRFLYAVTSIFGALILAISSLFAYHQLQTKNWPVVQGNVIASNAQSISFKYEVLGTSYTGSNAVTTLDVPPVVTVHYNPLAPAQSSINPGVQPVVWMFLLIGTVSFFAGLSGFLGPAAVTGGTGNLTYDGYGDVFGGGITPDRK